ncbi:MAG TPA: carboxypeptidase regulatory-like domain-containing protein [Candidatus Sulfotelmatobacter sp.]|nr:carboxypeptidase regulatory-like domain-containing protein [Candidatus Sulfotelmatobacter sp.]
MRVCHRGTGSFTPIVLLLMMAFFCVNAAWGQGSYAAQVRGRVTDQSGAIVVNATVTITNVATGIAQTIQTNDHGEYFFTGLRPATYTVKAQMAGFRVIEKTNVVLQVDQQTTVDFELHPVTVNETMEVTTTAPLLDTESATLGTEVSNEYVHELPLANRDFFGLTFLAAGVTEVAGSGTSDNYPSGTNFTSNGQRNATAEIRLDGSPLSAPEQGEGGNSNVYYEPLVEGLQEMKVQNNSFSAEFGNNGGTVVNMVMKSGTDQFHGSGWYFLQRAQLDARDFFNPAPNPKPDSRRDQGGFSLGGPIIKNRTFFFVDFEKVSSSSASSAVATVPTLAERQGDFSATATAIYDPTKLGCGVPCVNRPQVQYNGQLNVIPPGERDPIGMAVLNLYPKPTNGNEFNNFNYSVTGNAPDYQFDIKIDHQFSDKDRINGRYSRGWSNFTTPLVLGDGTLNDGIKSGVTVAQNASLEYNRTFNPRIVWTNRISLDRVHELSIPGIPTITSFNASLPSGAQGLPSVFEQANGIDKMPSFIMQGNSPWSNLYDQCCINTTFGHTLVSYSSQLVISKGTHLIKIGGEQRIFYNNFWQPNYPTGQLTFTDYTTSPTPNSNSGGTTGNPFASLAFGYGDNVNASSNLVVTPSVANRSLETGFYVQDDWKVNSKLTLNLGVRYQWSSPYTSRGNQIQFSNFTADSGVRLDMSSVQAALTDPSNVSTPVSFPSSKELLGTTQFASSSMRTIPTYRKDIGPRLGFSYQLDTNTVVRGGAGIYFGMSPATNFQYPGTAFRQTANLFFTNDNFATQAATLENPFPAGYAGPQGRKYGQYAVWGYQNANDLGTTAARDAELYQWNLGIQRLLPSQIVLGADYSANRSTHLPWAGTNNRSYIPSPLLAQITAAATPIDPTCQNDSCVSNLLATQVGNPFYSMFNAGCVATATHPCFNEPNSNYHDATLPLGTLLTTYPQFSGDFEGLMLETANSWYNALQIRFQKRTTHHISFEGSYTISKETDYSSAGRNNWVGALGLGMPQQLDRLSAEHSIGANDTPQRLAAAVVVDLPIGRKQWIGGNMNRGLDAVIGGWSIATIITEQTGQPMAIGMATARLANGTQRPNVVCSQLKTGASMHSVALDWQNAGNTANFLTYLNPGCFADPGDETPGNAPRYFPGLRVDGVHNVDANIYKSFVPKEGTRIEVRAEMFNFLNHPRFGQPNSGVGDPLFGTITGDAPGENPRSFQFGIRFEF